MARIITFVIFGGFGLVMLYVGITQLIQQRRSLTYSERIDAEIVHSEVFTSTSADTDPRLGRSTSTTSHRPDVRFRYMVGGQQYESDLLYPTIIVQSYASRENAAEALAPFPVHAKVRAYVDPSHPGQAFLIADAGKGPIVFIIIGLLLPPLAWFVGKYV
ncbi:MAG: DUF3592 domain-containing protein [Gemmatimonas sp.]